MTVSGTLDVDEAWQRYVVSVQGPAVAALLYPALARVALHRLVN